MAKPVLLLIDDDATFAGSLQRMLRQDYELRHAPSARDAEELLSPLPDAVLLDLRLDEQDATNRDSLMLLQSLRQRFPAMPVVMITAYGDVATAVECMKLGAADFIQKGPNLHQEIRPRLERVLAQRRVLGRVEQLEQELRLIEPRQIVGKSPKIEEVKRFIEAVAQDGRVTVLIRGETGTGKELVARAIHASGWRKDEPFIPVMLNALPHTTVESELFGYEPGAFTGAQKRHIGYLEKAHRGVLFLDEIGEVDANVQVKLLRFLEERLFQRLGSTTNVQVDVQIVAATNADLEQRVKEGKFREDLYFRLKVHEIVLPPLRERREDIPLLVEHFLTLFAQQGKRVHRISAEALHQLQDADWPGNVRQLRNTIESAIFRAQTAGHTQIEVEDIPLDVRSPSLLKVSGRNTGVGISGFSVDEALARTELRYVEEALRAVRGRKTEAWKLLGYNDRFALLRRVTRIFERYPALKQEFPSLARTFQGRD